MTDREKIIEIIAPYISAYGDDERIADALIEAGIGDVTEYQSEAEYWKTICKFESDEHHTAIKNAAEHARHLMQERDEYKHRVEVAEKALKLVSECDELSDAFCELIGEDNCDFKCHTCLYNYFLQQAEKELQEERKDD